MSSSVALNSFVLYEMAVLSPNPIVRLLAPTSTENAEYFISLDRRLLDDKKRRCGITQDVESHAEIDYYRYDIYQDLMKLALTDEITVVDVEEWYKRNEKRVRVIRDRYCRRLIAYGKRLYAIGKNNTLTLVSHNELPSNAISFFIEMSRGDIDMKILCDDGSVCNFDASACKFDFSKKIPLDKALHKVNSRQLPCIFIPL